MSVWDFYVFIFLLKLVERPWELLCCIWFLKENDVIFQTNQMEFFKSNYVSSSTNDR